MENNQSVEDCPEESSWTFYIQGFMCENDGNHDNTCLSSELESIISPSLVSDAASSAVKKLGAVDDDCNNVGFSSGKSTDHHHNMIPRNMCKQNSLNKKHKNKVVPPVDYDLEDTASSPVNSPKQVCCMNQFKGQKQKAKKDEPEVKRNVFGKGDAFGAERDTDNCTDIKRRTSRG